MNLNNLRPAPVEIRKAELEDIADISVLVGACGPYLSAYVQYLFFIYLYFFQETCFVAVDGGRIVGFCSVLAVGRSRFFMHQLAVDDRARGCGVGLGLLSHLLSTLKARHGDDFELMFTTDTSNLAVRRLIRKVAELFDMDLDPLAGIVPPLEGSMAEEFFRMTPLRKADVELTEHAAIAA